MRNSVLIWETMKSCISCKFIKKGPMTAHGLTYCQLVHSLVSSYPPMTHVCERYAAATAEVVAKRMLWADDTQVLA
jgi:hypothetical protein